MCRRLNAKDERHGVLAHFIATTFIYCSGEASLDELARELPARMAFVATRIAKGHLALLHKKGINPQNVAEYVSRALPQLESLLSDELRIAA